MTHTTKIYFDEHIHSSTIEVFKQQKFQCEKIKKTAEHSGKYGGRDEKDYIAELKSERAIFVTSDGKFVDYMRKQQIKHAGIVLLPTGWEDSTLNFAAAGMAGTIRGIIDSQGLSGVQNKIFIVRDDGYFVVINGQEKLIASIDAIELDLEEYSHKYPGLS